ncbi:MAG: isoleucine--tRNA ligase [bacterium]
MDYKSTLNLPHTAFPMKANLNQRENEFLTHWEEMQLYEKIKEKGKSLSKFILHDGPPYANGNIHMGHALNKILKDIIIKSKTMAGFQAAFIPGWDCHGLPIEHQVDKELGAKKENMDINQIRRKCREYAEGFVEIQKAEFKRLGVFGDWNKPYLTMDSEYEASIVREFAQFVRSGLVYKGFKPVHWCPSCQTALAEAEVEYMEHVSPSVYVKFQMDSSAKDLWPEIGKDRTWIIIWTTTPWTLPANLAVAVHPDINYVLVRQGNEFYIMANELLRDVMKKIGLADSDYKIIDTFNGNKLEGKVCVHPFIDRRSRIILAPFVTLDQGSGCVHIAPGHGQEDYEAGLQYGLDIYAPVDDRGNFTKDVEGFAGLNVFDANGAIIEKMSTSGTLLHQEKTSHSYPHCWRCKSPVIFRATEQWFISMDKNDLRNRTLREIRKVRWIPKWGENRITGMIENRPDWCISRQRSWGVPLVILYCASCEEPVLDADLIEKIAAQVEKEGVDIWFIKPVEDLVPSDLRCLKCGHDRFTKETDILDVWFESGVSHAAVLEKRQGMQWPADLYLEGSDQHRGWFHSSILIGVETHGRAPYKSVLTHGFVVDGEGKKMSKSAGNVIKPQKVIDRYGAEILRLWVAAEDYNDDIRISNDILTRLAEAYRRIRNTCRFILGNLYDFDPETDTVPLAERDELDRWIIHRFQWIKKRLLNGYKSYQFHICFHTLHQFCVVDLSSLYLDISKDRLYTSKKTDTLRRSAQSTMYELLFEMNLLMSPILVFTSDEVWKYLPHALKKEKSVHMAKFPDFNNKLQDAQLAERWERLLEIRGEVSKFIEKARSKKEIGHSLDAEVSLLAGDEDLYGFLSSYIEVLKNILIVSSIKISKPDASSVSMGYVNSELPGLGVAISKAPGKKCERCWQYSLTVGEVEDHPSLCKRCRTAIS